eukprot:m.1358928 g.1358928  ORF g.1358928 m.1358928 type:complete len:272 (+) comp24936_c0_seq6:307-1122(+)
MSINRRRWGGYNVSADYSILHTFINTSVVQKGLCKTHEDHSAKGSENCHPRLARFLGALSAGEDDDNITDIDPDITREGLTRYTAYLARVKMVLVKNATAAKAAVAKSIRYTAYSSDIGEGLRPVLPEWAIKAAYGIVGVYIVADIGLQAKDEYDQGSDRWIVARRAAHATTFQLVCSLALPTLVIHTAVKRSAQVFTKYGRFVRWGPSVVGLALIPFLPFIDEPCEELIDHAFHKFWPLPDGHQHERAQRALADAEVDHDTAVNMHDEEL